jgi:putative FmdB family regulatory protein
MCLAKEKHLPRYDYECQTCHNNFEVKQSFASEPVATCPVCHSGARRVIHSVPVVFKGSGFYVNDYGRGNVPTGARSDGKESKSKERSKSEPKAESGSSSKSESKKEPTSAK